MVILTKYYSPSCATKEFFMIHTKNGHALKLKYSDGEVRVSKTTFIEEYNKSAENYIKRK